MEDFRYSWRDRGKILPRLKNQRHILFCELFAHLTYMEFKLRERNIYGSLSAWSVMDDLPEGNDGLVVEDQKALNDKLVGHLVDNGVLFESDYVGGKKWNPRIYLAFEQRRGQNVRLVKIRQESKLKTLR